MLIHKPDNDDILLERGNFLHCKGKLIMSAQSNTRVDISHGVIRQWVADGQIFYLNLPNNTREVSTVAVDTLIDYFKNHDTRQPALVAIEVSIQNIMTPFGRQRFSEIPSHIAPDLFGRYAVIIPPGILGGTVRLFAISTIGNAVPPTFEGKTFALYEDAMKWLTDLLENKTP